MSNNTLAAASLLLVMPKAYTQSTAALEEEDKLSVNSYVDGNQILNRNLEAASVTYSNSDDMFTMADAVKMDNADHMVDITSIDANKPLSKAQIQQQKTTEDQ
ncbi:hypothetical protein Bhyg_02994, partial [Pseudolycoriella hygida]